MAEIRMGVPKPAVAVTPATSPAKKLTITEEIAKAHAESMMPEDEPFWLQLHALAKTAAEMQAVQAGFGPDAANKVAEAAGLSSSLAAEKAINKLGRKFSLGNALYAASLFAMGIICGWFGHGAMEVDSPIGPVPAEMKRVLHLQNWPMQWDRMKIQPPVNGWEWAYIPIVLNEPGLPGEIAKQ